MGVTIDQSKLPPKHKERDCVYKYMNPKPFIACTLIDRHIVGLEQKVGDEMNPKNPQEAIHNISQSFLSEENNLTVASVSPSAV